MLNWAGQKVFQTIHGNNLIYNQCWEDPRLDHEALQINESDRVMVLTSAGCNALDYVLKGPERVDAVDMNPRQNALLELKMAGIKGLEYDDFFTLFGYGYHPQADRLYQMTMREHMSPAAQNYWDKHMDYFLPGPWRRGFYYHGTAGLVAQFMKHYCQVRGLQEPVSRAFSAKSLEEQQQIYYEFLKPKFWNSLVRWVTRRGLTMSFLGVPRSQFLQIENYYSGGMAKFIEDGLEAVFAYLPLHENYFYHLYLFGHYTKSCCPNYLKEENFEKMKELVDRVHVHTGSVLHYLRKDNYSLTKVSLLDHMDWLYEKYGDILKQQWEALLQRSTNDTRIIWRSASPRVDFVDPLSVFMDGQWARVGDLLDYDTTLAETLHKRDRVHTYGSFYVAQVNFKELQKIQSEEVQGAIH